MHWDPRHPRLRSTDLTAVKAFDHFPYGLLGVVLVASWHSRAMVGRGDAVAEVLPGLLPTPRDIGHYSTFSLRCALLITVQQ